MNNVNNRFELGNTGETIAESVLKSPVPIFGRSWPALCAPYKGFILEF